MIKATRILATLVEPQSTFRSRVARIAYEYRFRILFLMVASLLVIYPFFQSGEPWRRYFFSFMFSLVLITCTAAGSVSRRQTLVSVSIGVPTLILHWIALGLDVLSFNLIIHVGYLLVGSHTIFTVLWFVAGSRRVTMDILAGAVSVYLLIGLNWAIVYSLIDHVRPDAFSGIVNTQGGFADFLYFSFTTQTTLGYGDIEPLDGYARAMANLEAIAGVLYLGAFVARLISVYRDDDTPQID